jgi:hypothetical protein
MATLVVNYNEQLLLEAYKVLMPNRVDCIDESTSLVNSQSFMCPSLYINEDYVSMKMMK